MLDLRRLAQTFVIDATDQGHSVAVIESAVEEFLAPLRAKEERSHLEKRAQQLTFDPVKRALVTAMSDFWEGDDVDELQAMLKIRFPKHHKTIDKLIELAGEASFVVDKDGPVKEYEYFYDRTIKALKKLPW